KRRLDAIAKTVNQIAKTQKLPAKHINQGFFDPSTLRVNGPRNDYFLIRSLFIDTKANHFIMIIFGRIRNV
ncbi:hypothetical protein, partial [Komagataeibacter rhaeticus]|uniref:hypothetical protein n=1 Tax=Komagataeibacter rhaeticus TaxID=215221 RepID=UPI001CD3E949